MKDNLIQKLQCENSFIRFMHILSEMNNRTIIISIKDIIGKHLGEDGLKALRECGCKKIDIQPCPDWRPYIFVKKNDKILYEEIGKMNGSLQTEIQINEKMIDVFSSPLHSGNRSSIIIDNLEYSVNKRGLNIVVISDYGEIIESVSIDIHSEDRRIIRLNENRVVSIIGRPAYLLANRKTGEIRERLKLENIFGDRICFNHNIEQAYKIRFFLFGNLNLWNAAESVVKAFLQDDRFDVLVIISAPFAEYITKLRREGINYLLSKNYVYEKDNPDIAVFNSSEYNFCKEWIKKISNNVYKVQLDATLINGARYSNGSEELLKKNYMTDIDLFIVAENTYETICTANRFKKELFFSFTNPKFDNIYNRIAEKKELPIEWGKIKNRRTILWAFDHNWTLNDCTFDQYIKPFIEYMDNNNDMSLVLRPHTSIIAEYKREKIWNDADYCKLKKIFHDSYNMIWDESDDYSMAYSVADAVITDVNCGIALSATVLDVPIAITHRFDGGECSSHYPEINECHYQIYCPEDAFSFFEMVKKGEDPKNNQRNIIKNKYIKDFDGKNGERIKKFIVDKYEEKLQLRSE